MTIESTHWQSGVANFRHIKPGQQMKRVFKLTVQYELKQITA